ncbi:hypothetical protein TRVL_09943 [Trypanosoma vivax]|nr:hypothetical protein TRVL_09943 [Trypanosoma vivax]
MRRICFLFRPLSIATPFELQQGQRSKKALASLSVQLHSVGGLARLGTAEATAKHGALKATRRQGARHWGTHKSGRALRWSEFYAPRVLAGIRSSTRTTHTAAHRAGHTRFRCSAARLHNKGPKRRMLRHRSPEYYRLADEGNDRHFAVQSSTLARLAALLCIAVRRRHTLTLLGAKPFGKQSSGTHCAPVLAHIACCKIRTLGRELWSASATQKGGRTSRHMVALRRAPNTFCNLCRVFPPSSASSTGGLGEHAHC